MSPIPTGWNLTAPAISPVPAGATRAQIIAWARAQEKTLSAWATALKKSLNIDRQDAGYQIADTIRFQKDAIADQRVVALKALRK